MKWPFRKTHKQVVQTHSVEQISAIADEFYLFEKNDRALEQARSDLLGRYPDSWVAFRNGKLVIVEKDETEFFEKYRKELSNDPTVAIAFLSSDPTHFVPTLAQ